MSDTRSAPLAPPPPSPPVRALPWLTVITGSLLTALPIVATVPLLPPFGLLVLLAWRLLNQHALRRWAAAPLGLFDDLVSGQPLGSAVLLWSLAFLLIELIEQRLAFRDYWQDWVIATGLIAFCVIGGRVIAVPLGAHVDTTMLLQGIAAALLFPVATRVVAWADIKRSAA
ncbi:rod shape-determining protein MreD [Sphingomonas sp.]|jgi:rod shape-determining protein MreD|uniref:rod shape-determining protein MreD n=1 Tax=Sphingomonas sp. TaxID=28214 RepID=UPI002D80BB3C|nr:rod shape-determining protein MreD [Sphingomonas sp.]HEU0044833.1 rod shape-determining protein MreD [Sphingomonas sp.]